VLVHVADDELFVVAPKLIAAVVDGHGAASKSKS
jgi:hypothetical protein